MPQRFLRPGITTSSRWNSVCWQAQSLYIRIITLVDDYGRCDGRASVIHGHCLSVWNEIHPADCCDSQRTAALLAELSDASLIELYQVEGKKILQVTQWQERIRDGAKEKWPANQNPQRSAAERSVPLPPSPPPPPSPSSAPSPSGVAEREQHFSEANGKMTLQEVKDTASMIGLAEWKAVDWFNEMEGCGWRDHNQRPIHNGRAVLARVKTKWESDGRPSSPPKGKYGPKPPTENPRNFGMPTTGKQAGERAVAELKARGDIK